MKNFVILLLTILPFTSCNKKNDCESIFPAPTVVQISIVDNQGISLIGEDNIYKPSEIRLSRENQDVFLEFYEFEGKTFIQLDYGQIQSMADYNFKLNDQETDILNLSINRREGDCFDILEVASFKLNNQEIQPISNLYTIRK